MVSHWLANESSTLSQESTLDQLCLEVGGESHCSYERGSGTVPWEFYLEDMEKYRELAEGMGT